MTPTKVHEFFKRLHAVNPEPKGELNFTNPYTLLVAVALSAQATDVSVNKATPKLFALADTPQKMAALPLSKIKSCIKTIGLYNAKAENIKKAAEILCRDYNGVVPEDLNELIKLPGVGRKTANVVLSMAFGHSTIAVDTHVFRVANRTGLAKADTPDKVEDKLMKVIPKEFLFHAHHWLILHGRYTCLARTPKCAQCIVRDLCAFKEKAV